MASSAFDPYAQWLGISPGKRPPDHYTLLGFPPFAGAREEIEHAAHDQLARLDAFALHPDPEKRRTCQQLMNEVALARTVLTDPFQRRNYDANLAGTPRPAPPSPAKLPTTAAAPRHLPWISALAVVVAALLILALTLFWPAAPSPPAAQSADVAPSPSQNPAPHDDTLGPAVAAAITRPAPSPLALTSPPTPATLPQVMPPGLVHLYTFNDGTARDSVGTAHGTLAGGATIVDGDLLLTGARGDQHVALPASGPDNRSAINIASYKELTVQCWFTFASPNPAANMWSALFSFGATASNGCGYNYILGHARDGWSQGCTRAVISNNAPQPGPRFDPRPWESQAIDRNPILDTSRHQFTLIIDTHAIAFYLDGILQESEPLLTTSTGPTSLAGVSNETAYIGDSVWRSDPSFAGRIHEFSIFNRALTPAEVMETYQRGPVPTTP